MRKLEEIVREFYIEDLGLSNIDNRYPRFLQIAATGLNELNMDLKSIITEVTLPVNANDTVNLPSNYIDYVAIGIVNGDQFSGLGLNRNVAPRAKGSCGGIQDVTSTDNDSGAFLGSSTFYTADGEFRGGAYGLGGGGNSNGTYNIYKQDGYISLNNSSASEIVLRYIASVEQVDGNFMIEEYLVDAIKSWIWHRYIRRMRSYSESAKDKAEAEFNRKKKLAMKRENRFSIPEFMNAFRSGYRSSPKI